MSGDSVWSGPTRDAEAIYDAVRRGAPVQVSTYPQEAPGWMLASRQDRTSIAHWLSRGCSFRISVLARSLARPAGSVGDGSDQKETP